MKLTHQTQHILYSSTYYSEYDWKQIKDFCLDHGHRVGHFEPTYSETGLTYLQFHTWYDTGFAPGEIALYESSPVLIGRCSHTQSHIIAYLSVEKIKDCDIITTQTSLTKLDIETQNYWHRQLSIMGLEYNRNEVKLSPKFTPKINERIRFYNNNLEGIGVIRNLNTNENYIELYCYFIYNSKRLGYSMHETGICNYHDFHFEIMDIVGQRRLDSELKKCGIVWSERLHRIEPINARVPKGKQYWYITDKMKVQAAIEKDTLTSHFRYRVGNYFRNPEAAKVCLDKFFEILRDEQTL